MQNIICYTTLYPNSHEQTKGIFVYELCRAISEHYKIHVIAPVHFLKKYIYRIKAIKEKNIFVYHPYFFVFPKVFKMLDGKLLALFTQKSFKEILKYKPLLIHAHYTYPDGYAAMLLSKRYKIPYILTIHGSDINILAKDLKRRNLIIQTLNGASAIVGVSKDLIKKAKKLGIKNKNFYHIPNGVDIKKFFFKSKLLAKERLNENYKNKFLLIAIGRLVKIKGFDNLIEAISLLPSQKYHLIIIGHGPEKKYLKKLVKKKKLEKRVEFLGPILHNQLYKYYQAADFLIISSYMEGWPTIIYEALACGTPIIAPKVGGIAEILSDKNLGILVEDNRPQSLAEGIIEATKRKWNIDLLLKKAQANSWNNIAQKYITIFRSIN